MRVLLALVFCLAPLQADIVKQLGNAASFAVQAPVRAGVKLATAIPSGVKAAAQATWPGPFGPQPPAVATGPATPVPVMDALFEEYQRHMNVMHPESVARLQRLALWLDQCGGNIVCWRHKAGFAKAFKPNMYHLLGVASNLGEGMNAWDLNLYGVHLCIEYRGMADYLKLPCFQ